MGSGKQWMNWIHIHDLIEMYIFVLENPAIKGKFNAVADEISTNKNFMKTLAKYSHKFFLPMNVPTFLMKIIFGEMSAIILKGTRTCNIKIKSQGFNFQYHTLNKAFGELLGK